MDWTWFLFSFEGRIGRAKIWLAALIWFATVFSFMTLFLVVAGILWSTGHELDALSASTMHPRSICWGCRCSSLPSGCLPRR